MGSSLTKEQKEELQKLNEEIKQAAAEAKAHTKNCSELTSFTMKVVVGCGSIDYYEIVPDKKKDSNATICSVAEEINKKLQELYSRKQKLVKEWKIDWDYN